MFAILLTLIFTIYHYAAPKTIDKEPPHQKELNCNECFRIYFPLCASDNETYTNECRFRCVQSKKPKDKRARILRYGPCILGSRKKRFVINLSASGLKD